jgi:hypothetical protein
MDNCEFDEDAFFEVEILVTEITDDDRTSMRAKSRTKKVKELEVENDEH